MEGKREEEEKGEWSEGEGGKGGGGESCLSRGREGGIIGTTGII